MIHPVVLFALKRLKQFGGSSGLSETISQIAWSIAAPSPAKAKIPASARTKATANRTNALS